ncbi:MAG: NAD-dependent deacylase [Candidatus Aminicenantes bacterium]|nr:NAD-dependent deacylase [Candidatus Aminicenantes bacterium]
MNTSQDLTQLIDILLQAERIAILTGAGISAESNIPTFRGEDGLWKKYRPEQLATPEAFSHDPHLVWEWYDWRRKIINSKNPNPGHKTLAKWETIFPSFTVITQNIDGFHQKAGSVEVLELHGNIWKTRCTQKDMIWENNEVPLKQIPPVCPKCGAILRPHVVWFGESLDLEILNKAFQISRQCEVMFVIGTSAIVQPAASLPLSASDAGAKIIEINPEPTSLSSGAHFSFRGRSGEILPMIDAELDKVKKQA